MRGEAAASQHTAASPLQERLRGVENVPQWEADAAADEPPRLGRVAPLPAAVAAQAMLRLPEEWRAPHLAAVDESANAESGDDIGIVRRLPLPCHACRSEGVAVGLLVWAVRLVGASPTWRRRRGRRLPRVSDAQTGRDA